VAVSAAKIDSGGGVEASNMRALARALEAVAHAESVNLVDWYQIQAVDGWNGEVLPQRVEGGDRVSAAIAAASIVAKETRDQLMRGLDLECPGTGSRRIRATAAARVSMRRRSAPRASCRRRTG
jgi:ribonuclease HII